MKPPPLLWKATSTATMAATGILSRIFLYGTQRVEIDGMDAFLALLKSRREERNSGLLTGLFDPTTGLREFSQADFPFEPTSIKSYECVGKAREPRISRKLINVTNLHHGGAGRCAAG